MSKRFTYVEESLRGWLIIDTKTTPATRVCCVDDVDADADATASHLCELLNRDHEMRAAVNAAAPKGTA